MPKDVCTIELPQAGTTQVVNLTAGEVNTLSFSQDSIIGDPRLNADGSVAMDLINGSSVVINNFQELADSAQSCGRDTIIQLSDNTIIYPEELYTQLAAVSGDTGSAEDFAAMAPAAGDSADGDVFGVTSVNAPVDGSQELTVQAGQEYQFGFDLADVQSMTQEGSDLVIGFPNGETLTMVNYFTMANGALPPVVSLADGSVVDAASLLPTFVSSRSGDTTDGTGDLASLAPTGAEATTAADIEPASGEEAPTEDTLEVVEATVIEGQPETVLESVETTTEGVVNQQEEIAENIQESETSENVDLANVAEQLAAIEPAAGEAGTAGGSRGGFGFQSGVDSAELINDPAVGPHGYTALNYDAPEFIDEPLAVVDPVTQPRVPVPGFAVPSLVVKEDSSIDIVVDAPTTGPNDTLFVEIDVPAGWSVVDLNGGTYDAVTGIWSFTTLPGVDFLGGPEVSPPADSDIDSEVLDARVTATDTTTGLSGTSTDTFNIITDAVADTPDLAATNATGEEGTTIPLNITTAPTDVDGSEVISVVRISDVPTGATLTAGTEVAPGVWELDVTDLVGLGINVPDGTTGNFTLNIESVADETVLADSEFDFTDNQASAFTDLVVSVTPDDVPLPQDQTRALDETDLGPLTTGGTVVVDFGTDGPGTITPKAANTFTVDGSVAGGNLSSNGSDVTVVLNGSVYTGRSADGRDIFTLEVNPDGTYSFELLDTLDHADGTNPNDVINLHFCYQAEDSEGDTADGLITIQIADDAPVAQDDSNALSDTETVETGNILTNDSFGEDGTGSLTQVTFNGTTFPVPTVGTVTVTGDYGVLELAADGSYTYTRTTDDAGQDEFDYTIVDFDGDASTATLTITLEDANVVPIVSPAFEVVDETDLPGVTESGQVIVDFGTDGSGTVVGNNNFISSGSQLGGNLTSNGLPVTVELVGNQYVGYTGTDVATGTPVFTLDVETDGSYEFNLLGTLDHADPNDPNDIINLEFGVNAVDEDQDVTPTTITVLVKDDVPTIGDSRGDVDETNFENGDLVFSDTLFTDFGTEAASFTPGGNVRAEVGGVPFALTSGLEPVTLVQTATGYEGTTATNGSVFTLVMDFTTGQYVYTQTGQFDHPDATDSNDTIELLFDFTVESSDGDTDTGTVTISIADDGPVANDDTNGAAEGQDITGSVVANDDLSEDNPNTVSSVEFNGTTYSIVPGIPAVIATPLGELTLNADGSYEFDAVDSGDPDGTVDFTYTLVDSDGDRDTATLSIKVTPNGEPVIVSGDNLVDETALDLGPLVVNDTLNVDFGLDGAGSVNPNGTTSFGGSATAGNLTSNDVPVVIQSTATGYEGVLAGTTTQVFELIVQDTGAYSFELFGPLDHAEGSDPNDAIQLNFGVTAADFGGDTADAVITINVLDDAPIANDDVNMYDTTFGVATGNVIANDDLSEDDAPAESADHDVVEVSFGGTTVTIPEGGSNTIEGDFGILTMFDDGTYSYALKPGAIPPGMSMNLLDPTPADVAGTQSTITKSGITVTSENGGDLRWTDDGIGIYDGGGSDRVFGNDEALNVTFDAADSVVLTMGDLGNNPGSAMDFVVYLSDGSTRTIEVPVTAIPQTNSAGSVTFTGADYGAGLTITGVDVFSHNTNSNFGKTSFSLVDVKTTHVGEECIADAFEYVLQDGDGDQSTASLTLKGKDLTDDKPEIGDGESTVDETDLGPLTVSGTVSSDFGADTGTIAPTGASSFVAAGSVAGGVLTSGGTAVNVTVNGNTYTGTAGTEEVFTLVVEADGTFTFNLTGTLDHADTTNPDDVIDLMFGVTGEDSDGDTDTGTITIHVNDDGPSISNRFAPGYEADLVDTGSFSVTRTMDFDFGQDGPGDIKPTGNFMAKYSASGASQTLTSDGVVVDVTPTADGYVGYAAGEKVFDLTVNPTTGEFTYTQFAALDHPDATDPNDLMWLRFEVQITDADGDTAVADIGIDIRDDGPSIETKFQAIDETGFDGTNPISYTQALNFNFGADGPGVIRPTGSFQALFQVGGNNQPLTSAGELVTVTATTDGYVGTLANGDVVLDVVINATTAEYTYTQYQAVDHPDGTNHDDVIWLKFEVEIVDADGDTDTAIIGVDVHDDGPKAHDDYYIPVGENTREVTGNVLDNDAAGADIAGVVANVQTFDGWTPAETYAVPEGGALILAGDFGKLQIASDGAYTYERTTNDHGLEKFQYTLQDADGDTDVAWFKFRLDQGCLKYGDEDLQLQGTAGDDVIVGNDADNVIESGLGEDMLYGGSGQDTFLFEQASVVDASVDRVADFDTGEGDVLDLSDFLQSYDPTTHAIEDFIFQREVNGDTVISVDTSGSGNAANAQDLVVLESIAGEDLDQLVLNAQTTV